MKSESPRKRASKKPAKPSAQTVRLQLEDPSATTAAVAGSFNEWNPCATPMTAAGPGCWAAELTLAPGQYEYLLVVDGQWRVDPSCTRHVPNPFGGLNCLLDVPAPV